MIAWLRRIDDDPRTERVIMLLILVNAVILGLETDKSVMASYGPLLQTLDHFILAVFVIEILARMLVHQRAFFRDPWSVSPVCASPSTNWRCAMTKTISTGSAVSVAAASWMFHIGPP